MKKHYKMIITYIAVIIIMISFAFGLTKTVTVFVENPKSDNRKIVVIDAGHGGIDGGAVSCTGIPESKTNLEIAIKLKDVCNLLGIKTVMIRTEDISVYTEGNTIAAKKVSDLKERVRIVNDSQAALVISIHQNYFTDPKYSGAQIFYNDNDQAKSLSNEIQILFNNHLGSNRQSKAAQGVYLMQHIDSAGLLIECGFLSNRQENELLQSKEYQQKISVIIASAISCYLNT